MKPISIGLNIDTLERIKTVNPGRNWADTINNILDEYKTPASIASAIEGHLTRGTSDQSPIKRTSVYMSEKWVDALRARLRPTHLPFDATMRILVEDWLHRRESGQI